MSSFEKYQKRRLRLSSFSVILSIALILFLLGLLGLLIIQSNKIATNFKENFEINIFLSNKAKKNDIDKLKNYLENQNYTKTVNYVSKIDAYNTYLKEVGEDFMEELDENPLKNGFNLYLNAAYFDIEKIEKIEDQLANNKFIDDIAYSKATVSNLSNLIKKSSFWLLSFSALLGLISIVLINSYLRLSVYAKRFNIKTMQMVGATKKFIRKPFLYKSIKLGIFGALLAILILGTLLFYFNYKYTGLALLDNKLSIAVLFLAILLLGVLIAGLSTYFATKKFLKLKTDELYY